MVKNLPANAGDGRDTGSIPGLGKSSGGGHSNPLQYSCLENSMDRGAWRATVRGSGSQSRTRLKRLSRHAHTADRRVQGGPETGAEVSRGDLCCWEALNATPAAELRTSVSPWLCPVPSPGAPLGIGVEGTQEEERMA